MGRLLVAKPLIMTIKQLQQLINNPQAPFNHEEYTVWLHNKIIDQITHEVWEAREGKAGALPSGYAAVNHIMALPSLKRID